MSENIREWNCSGWSSCWWNFRREWSDALTFWEHMCRCMNHDFLVLICLTLYLHILSILEKEEEKLSHDIRILAFEGMFHKGQRHGSRIRRNYDGQKYCGMLEFGLRSGWGIWVCNNGEKYEGQWKDRKFYGLGKLQSSNEDWLICRALCKWKIWRNLRLSKKGPILLCWV